jgi:hypothetical protein
MPLGSHGTSFELWEDVSAEDETNWTAVLPYYQTSHAIKLMSELPENDNTGDEISKTVSYLSSHPNAQVKKRAEEGDVEAGIDYGLR